MSLDRLSLAGLAMRYTEAWCSQDPGSVAACYSPDGSLSINGATPAVGRPAIEEVARSFMTAFPDLRVAMDELRTGGAEPEYHWTLTGCNTGPGGTGQFVRISGVERWRIDAGGLIACSQGRFDEADYRRQLNQKS
jgi:nuclear transport factor 2 (NTF2) superfamily protein